MIFPPFICVNKFAQTVYEDATNYKLKYKVGKDTSPELKQTSKSYDHNFSQQNTRKYYVFN